MLKRLSRDHVNAVGRKVPEAQLLVLDVRKTKTYKELCMVGVAYQVNEIMRKTTFPVHAVYQVFS